MKKFFRNIFSYLRQTDLWLWVLCLGLSGFSIVLLLGILDAGKNGLTMRTIAVQGFAAALGIFCAFVLSKFDYHTLGRLWKLHVPLAYAFVLITFIPGVGVGTADRQGDRSWIEVPFTTMTIQPAEFLKISFILAFAYHLNKVKENINQPSNLIPLCLHGAIPVLLIHFQGDDGTALVFACIFVAMMFAAGLSFRYIAAALGAAALAFPLLWFFVLADYQKQRFLILFNPDLADPQGGLLPAILGQASHRLREGVGERNFFSRPSLHS